MTRWLGTIAIAMLALAIFALYTGVARVKAQHKAIETLKAEIAREHEAIRVLKAEWSYLNQPERLQALVRRHSGLTPTKPSQITTLSSLPERKPATVGETTQ